MPTTVWDTAILDQDRRGKDALLRAYDNFTSLVGDCPQILLAESLNHPSVSIVLPNFADEGTEDRNVY